MYLGPRHSCAILLALCACTPDPRDTRDSAGDTQADTQADTQEDPLSELVPEGGCALDEALFTSVSAEATGVPTVVRTAWELAEPAAVQVLWAIEGAEEEHATVPGEAASTGKALLFGAPAERALRYRLVAGEEGTYRCSGLQGAETGSLPVDFPLLNVQITDSEAISPGYLLTNASPSGSQPWSLVLDGAGQVLWAWSSGMVNSRVRIAPDLQAFLVATPGGDGPDDDAIMRVGLDGGILDRYTFPHIWIDFAVLPDGAIAALTDDVRDFEYEGETRHIMGQALVLREADGSQRTLWSIFDALMPDLTQRWNTFTSFSDTGEDWSHVNGVSYSPEEDAFYLSSGTLHAIFKVDRQSGATLWELSARGDDWTIEGGEMLIEAPHSAERTSTGTLLIFNRYGTFETCSEAVEIALDAKLGTATRIWGAASGECLHVNYLGGAQRLSNGNTLVSWSDRGVLDELLPDGSPALRISLPEGAQFGFAEKVPTLW